MSTLLTNQSGPSSGAATEPEKDGNVAIIRKREVAILVFWLTACSAVVFSRSFRLPYCCDDTAHLHALTTLRTGQISLSTWFFLNPNEHIVPLLRFYFLVATRITGLNALALHIMVFLTHVAGTVACAWIFFSLTRSRLGTFLAGTIYATAGGFAGSTVWQPTVAQFPGVQRFPIQIGGKTIRFGPDEVFGIPSLNRNAKWQRFFPSTRSRKRAITALSRLCAVRYRRTAGYKAKVRRFVLEPASDSVLLITFAIPLLALLLVNKLNQEAYAWIASEQKPT